MKISLNWLKEYIKFSVNPEQLAHRLTMAGLEVEQINKSGSDTVFELEIPPNRADCLSHLGIARELSAILNKKFILPKIKATKPFGKNVDIEIIDKTGCSFYSGVVIQGVSARAADKIMIDRLSAIGLRSISNIVDITNFCLFESGQPLHAFDFDKLED